MFEPKIAPLHQRGCVATGTNKKMKYNPGRTLEICDTKRQNLNGENLFITVYLGRLGPDHDDCNGWLHFTLCHLSAVACLINA